MTYIVPADPQAVNFDLSGPAYAAPTDPLAVDFDLTGASDPPPVAWPIPPGIMVSSTLSVALTGSQPVSSAGDSYSMTPEQRAVRRALRSAMASQQHDGRSPQGWDKTRVLDESVDEGIQPWGAAQRKDPGHSANGWDSVPVKDESGEASVQTWDDSIRPIDGMVGQGYNVPPFKDSTDEIEHADSAKYWEVPPVQIVDGYVPGYDFDLTTTPYPVPDPLAVSFDLAGTSRVIDTIVPTRPLFSGRDLQGWTTNTPADIRIRHPWDDKPRKGTEVTWDYDQELGDPPDPDPEPPETSEVYFYMNASSLLKMPEGIPLEFSDLSITLDIDSFSWALSASILNRESMDQIRPGPAGPVEVEATVNNKTWRFMVERYTLEQKFPRESYRITGSSLTQLLAAPYSPKESAQIETPTNAQQVIQDVLEFTGFSVVWDSSLADFTIPAGAWGYENKTPIEVIDELVKAAGGILVPTLSLSELRAKHRYSAGAPWDWSQISDTELDFVIVDSTILGLSSQWEPNPPYNGVYVSGISDGVAVECIRDGTAGDVAAPDDFHALNLTTQQSRGKGISLLGQGGDQEIVTIEIPIPTSGAPGLVIPGQWGEIQDSRTPGNSWRGLVLSTAISVARPGSSRAVQVIKLERHHY